MECRCVYAMLDSIQFYILLPTLSNLFIIYTVYSVLHIVYYRNRDSSIPQVFAVQWPSPAWMAPIPHLADVKKSTVKYLSILPAEIGKSHYNKPHRNIVLYFAQYPLTLHSQSNLYSELPLCLTPRHCC